MLSVIAKYVQLSMMNCYDKITADRYVVRLVASALRKDQRDTHNVTASALALSLCRRSCRSNWLNNEVTLKFGN